MAFIRKITHWLVRQLIRDYQDINNVAVRARYGTLESWVSITLNFLLFVIKVVLGIMLHSVSLIADAIHTLSDTGTSIIILIGFKIAKKPGDREHPFGHGRAESIAALIVAVMLMVAGLELIKSAGQQIFSPRIRTTQISWTIAAILIGTIVAKELMARFAIELAKMIKSKTLEADAWHHRSDALSTVLVLAAMLCAHLGHMYVDGVAGVSVALIVMYSGYKIARDAMSPLLGEGASPKRLLAVENVALSVEGVQGVHDIIVHRYGQLNLTSLHIEVSDNRPVNELHDLSERVERIIEKKLSMSAVVHIDPLNKYHEQYQEIYDHIGKLVEKDERIMNFHDLRIVEHGSKVNAVFDITLAGQMDEKEISIIKQSLRCEFARELPHISLSIKAETPYSYNQ